MVTAKRYFPVRVSICMCVDVYPHWVEAVANARSVIHDIDFCRRERLAVVPLLHAYKAGPKKLFIIFDVSSRDFLFIWYKNNCAILIKLLMTDDRTRAFKVLKGSGPNVQIKRFKSTICKDCTCISF